MMHRLARFAAIAALVASTASCALSLRNPDIADLQRHPARYQDRTVSVNGVVTSSWGVPLVPFRSYKVDDGGLSFHLVIQIRRHHAKDVRPVPREDDAGVDANAFELARLVGRVDARRQRAAQPACLRLLEERERLIAARGAQALAFRDD